MSSRLNHDDLARQLRLEFIDHVNDRIENVNATLAAMGAGHMSDHDGLVALQRDFHTLKGAGTSFGFPIITLIAQRFEDFVAAVTAVGDSELRDLQIFSDRVAEMIERAEQPSSTETSSVIRGLPVKTSIEVEVRAVEILLVTPSKVVSKVVTRDLAGCGYNTLTVHDPVEAIAMALRVPPDMLIASAVTEGMSGIELITGLRSFTVTRAVPMALLTSLDTTDAQLRALPDDVSIIRAGANFGEDVAATIAAHNL